jgi:large subunit ribosomal protein L17
MRHNKKVNHLGRTAGHRHALLSNMAASLIRHKRITTTEAKAKALRVYVEPLITKSKSDTTHSRRVVFSYLQDKEAVTELFRTVAPKIADRPGGYTRVLKIGFRQGDAADMALIELVDFNESALAADKKTTKKTTRRSRSKKEKTDQTGAEPAGAKKPAVEESVVAEPPAEEPAVELEATAQPEAAAEATVENRTDEE